jgi:hypothetical protein
LISSDGGKEKKILLTSSLKMSSCKIRFIMVLAVASTALQTASFAPQSSNQATSAALRVKRDVGFDQRTPPTLPTPSSGSESTRRQVLSGIGSTFASAAWLACNPAAKPAIAAGDSPALDSFFARQMASDAAQIYERRVATKKAALFAQLLPSAKRVLEIGVGTGPNFRYPGVRIINR